MDKSKHTESTEENKILDTDSDEYFDKFGNAVSDYITLYNAKLVFDKDTVMKKPLDAYRLGGSSQRNTVFRLKKLGTQSMAELADNINYDRGNMTKLVDYLVEQGLARRFQKSENRRKVFVELTEKGEDLIDAESKTFVINMRAKMESKLDEKQRLDFLEIMCRAVEYLKLL